MITSCNAVLGNIIELFSKQFPKLVQLHVLILRAEVQVENDLFRFTGGSTKEGGGGVT